MSEPTGNAIYLSWVTFAEEEKALLCSFGVLKKNVETVDVGMDETLVDVRNDETLELL